MSKVICDVCGTTYPDTASVCPICGCAKNTTVQTSADAAEDEKPVYTYVKGGRFSKANVRKRNRMKQQRREPEFDDDEGSDTGNKALIIVVIMLVLAILSVMVYIGVRYFLPSVKPKPTEPAQTQSTEHTEPSNTKPTVQRVPCTNIVLDNTDLKFTAANYEWLLSASLEPKDTTDQVTFTSSDESVATVSATGAITPIGYGECIITVRCGDMEAQCKVTCTFGTPPETEPSVPDVVIPDGFELKLNRKDFTISDEGGKWALYKETSGVKPSDITWTSSDEKVATVKDGVVTGVNYGDCTITATIGDQSASCIVRIRFRASTGGDGGDTDTVKISHKDVTITVGESFNLTLVDGRGAKIDVEWNVDAEGYVSINGSRITGTAATVGTDQKFVKISAEHEGTAYTCIVRVAAPKEN